MQLPEILDIQTGFCICGWPAVGKHGILWYLPLCFSPQLPWRQRNAGTTPAVASLSRLESHQAFFFSFWRERSHSYIFKSLSEMQEIKNRGFLVNSHCCCLSSDVFVHIDTYTAETGVSRFLQLNKNWRLVFYFDLKSVHQSSFFFFFIYSFKFSIFLCVFWVKLRIQKKIWPHFSFQYLYCQF